MEEAGASILPSPGMLHTPKQMLFQEAGVLPKYAEGKSVDASRFQVWDEKTMQPLTNEYKSLSAARKAAELKGGSVRDMSTWQPKYDYSGSMGNTENPVATANYKTATTPEQMKAALAAAKADGKITPQEAQQLRSMVFNIGMDVGGEKNMLTKQAVLDAIKSAGLETEHASVVFAQPDKKFGPFENTLVVKAKGNPKDLKEVTHSLAEILQQEAIPAKFLGEKTGVLAGPKAENWGGIFEPTYFVEHGKTTAGGNISPIKEVAKKVLAPTLWNAPVIADRAMEVSKGKDLAENAIGLALDVAPFTPATVAAGLMRPTDLGDATLDTWTKKKALEDQAYREQLRKTSPVFLK
jgi:hypothetical protein